MTQKPRTILSNLFGPLPKHWEDVYPVEYVRLRAIPVRDGVAILTREQRRRCLRTRGAQSNDFSKLDYLKFLDLLSYEAVGKDGIMSVAIALNDPPSERPKNLHKIDLDDKKKETFASFARGEWFKGQRKRIGKEKPFTGKDNGLLYAFVREYRSKPVIKELLRRYWSQSKEEGRFANNFSEFYIQAGRLSEEFSEEEDYTTRQSKLQKKIATPKKEVTERDRIVAELARYERDGNEKLIEVTQKILDEYDAEN